MILAPFMAQASSEHPLAKAIVEYARHFHFFDEPSTTKDTQNRSKESKFSSWLLDVSDFSALPGRGVQCFIDGKQILVSFLFPPSFFPFIQWPLLFYEF